MKVLHVIHGYPPFYMAGSEVYTYNLTQELSKEIDINIFTRIENPYEKMYFQYNDKMDRIGIRRINKFERDYTLKDKILDENIDHAFSAYLNEINPDIVHFGHLSHLSTNLVNIAKEQFNLPVIYTIHDFWLFCYRGQLIKPSMEICKGPSDENCFDCAKHFFKEKVELKDIVEFREHMNNVINNIDYFLSPSIFLQEFFINNGVPKNKIIFSKYGFKKDLINYKNTNYSTDSKITFGFMGRIIPVKGIRMLIEAFNGTQGRGVKLLIFGGAGSSQKYLDQNASENIIFKGSYKNWEINSILDQIDVLLVPSLWYENSPLVIQEAFLAGVPVITSNIGGMTELIENNVNGLTFEVGNLEDLKRKLNKIIEDPTILNKLKPNRDKVRSIENDASDLISLYKKVLNK